ncbi:isocitrate lyase/PEP mutase family protein [Pseudoteredinibacter isoporae]|uniref:isocitrate lyase/PEP mutase family protein n=1 Tax=Pseudoteredinibacter isoporae TaxID=570281 RepID=UPI003106CAE4
MNQNNVAAFRQLHYEPSALLLANVWDCASAALVQRSGAKAIATSSASLAWANGYADGGALPVDVLLNSVERITKLCQVPLSVDIEAGYCDKPEQVVELVIELVGMGVVGINIEDGQDSPDLLCAKLKAIRRVFGPDSLFINARTDVYLQSLVATEQQRNETQQRLARYAEYGADSVFVPGLLVLEDIRYLVTSNSVPLNIMLPSLETAVDEFIEAGVKRLSYGPGSFIAAYKPLSSFMGGESEVAELNYETLNELMLRPV